MYYLWLGVVVIVALSWITIFWGVVSNRKPIDTHSSIGDRIFMIILMVMAVFPILLNMLYNAFNAMIK